MSIDIPPNSLVSVPVVISGYIPNSFNGPDPSKFDPRRFVVESTTGKETLRDEATLAQEGWMPWTVGPRSCPGKKFSQVEFVSLVSHLLLQADIKVVDRKYEGNINARDTLNAALADTIFNLGTTVKRADEIYIEFVPRART